MALRKIVEIGEDCLNKVCRPVTEFNPHLHVLLDDMAETLADANGAGLAAPQVGVLRRVCLVLDGPGGLPERPGEVGHRHPAQGGAGPRPGPERQLV